MYSVAERDAIKQRLIERAYADPAIVGAALIGSTATGSDRWSDLDLTFAVATGRTVSETLEAWTAWIAEELGGAKLADLPVGGTIYRVFIFPGALQVDLSFSEQGVFGSRSPRFALLFGDPVEHPYTVIDQSKADNFGWGAHHVIRARVCIERELPWQAQHWLHEARASALTLACLRHGIEARSGKGFDKLPTALTDRFADALARSIDLNELRRALAVTTSLMIEQVEGDGGHVESAAAILAAGMR
jgi:hypothetical protein